MGCLVILLVTIYSKVMGCLVIFLVTRRNVCSHAVEGERYLGLRDSVLVHE